MSDSDIGTEKPTMGMSELSRSMTVQLSPEQYERLFFQPTAAKGDLAKRLGRPPFTVKSIPKTDENQETQLSSGSWAFSSHTPASYSRAYNSKAHPPNR